MREKLKKIKSCSGQDIVKLVLILCILCLFAVFLIGPVVILFIKAFQDKSGAYVGFQQFKNYLTSANMLTSLMNTIYISVISTIISVTFALIFAYALSRKAVPFKKPLKFLAMLPMLAPTMLLGLSLVYLMGNKGLLTQIGIKLPLYGKLGIIISESIYGFPVALMILTVAFSAADNRLYEAADVMGTSSIKKFFTITIPGIKYGLITSVFVCFTYSFSDFGAPSVVGGNYNVLATDIYKQVIGQQNFNMGAVVGIVMMIPTVISFAVDRITESKQSGLISSKSVPYQIKKHKPSDIAFSIYCILVVVFLIGFFSVSFYCSIVTFWPYHKTLTFKHYDLSKIAAGSGMQSIIQSVKVSVLTAVIGTAIAFITAYAVEKLGICPKIRKLIYLFSISPNAIPGTVIGLAYILFFNPLVFPIPGTDLAIENSFNFLYGTTAILVIVNIIHYFSVPFVTASTALKRLDNEFETVSDSMKVPFYKTFFRITVPLSIGAIFEMFAYLFMNSMITVSAVIFLYTPITKLASIVVLNVKGAGNDAEAAALCMLIMGINLIVKLIYEIANKAITKRTEKWMLKP